MTLHATMPDADATTALARRFPADFTWGVATSAFQIEGGAQADGKGPSIWDAFCRQPGAIADASNGDLACDHYHRWAEDLDLIASLGVPSYRFSVSWPRVQPDGRGTWNAKGLDFYRRLVDGLVQRGIAPHLTLNHWDLPLALQQDGGWAARDTAARFVDYARGVHEAVGASCHSIATHNEPWVIAVLGHEQGIFAPGVKDLRTSLQVVHHLLLSHGLALQALRADGCRAGLGIVLNLSHVDPATDSDADRAQATLDEGKGRRWYADPLFKGSYPEDIWQHYGADVPQVHPGDLAAIAQPLDFLGINNYTRHVASASGPFDPARAGLPVTDMGWEVRPAALTQLLQGLHRDYRPSRILVTENGAAFRDTVDPDGEVRDADRTRYLFDHLHAVADARDHGVPVDGYMVWSLMDNFEWASGYAKRFGIVRVDEGTLRRRPKASAHWVRDLLAAWRSVQ
jgi:beta-glucosidase